VSAKEVADTFGFCITEFDMCMTMKESSLVYKDYFLPRLQDLYSKRIMREKILAFLPNIENDNHSFSEFRKISEAFQRDVGMCGFLELEKQDFTHEEAIKKFFDDYEKEEELILTGINGLDDVIGGFAKANLIIIAGRPGMGKSALGLQFAKTACDSGKNVLFYSMEMTNRQLYARIMSNELINTDIRVPYRDFVQKKVHSNEYPKAKEYLLNTKSSMKIDYSSSQSLEAIRQGSKLDAIVVDHLAKMDFSGDNSKEFRNRYTNAIVGLKKLAKDMGIPVIVLCQLNRESSRRADVKPLLSDLKETGAIEEEADIVLFPFRPSYYDKDKYKPEYFEIIVAKNRDGEGGVTVRCNGDIRYNHIIDDHNDFIKGKEGWTMDAIMLDKGKPKGCSAIDKFRDYQNVKGLDF
jgi:replicative DNA helicase